MKVSILVSDLSKRGAGRWGGAVRTFLLAQALQQAGFEVEVLGFVFDDTMPDFSHVPFPVKMEFGGIYPDFFKTAGRLNRQISGDLLYPLRPKPTTLGLAFLDRLRTGRPIILDVDDWELGWMGGDEFTYRPSLKQRWRDLIKPDGALRQPDCPVYIKRMEKLVDRADAVTVHTRFLQDRFGGVYLPNGKDTTRFDPQLYDPERSRAKYGLSNYRVLMFPGAPRPYKGVEDILNALDRLDWSDLRLAIVGGSPYDDYDRQLHERWGRWIVQIPPQPSAKMPEVVAAAHVVVVPQRETPVAKAQFPLKLTDGMAMEKPILATSIGDVPEILQDTGFVVAPQDPEQLAQGIRQIFTDWDSAVEKGRGARERCVQYYSIDWMAQRLKRLIDEDIQPLRRSPKGAART